jgi:HD-GYP domain-containing protein (c-di-GMP phosphodiesterase class II)
MDSLKSEPAVRSAELVAALSLATDLGTGQPREHALRVCVIATRLADLAGADEAETADAYWTALLHSAGCTADAYEAALLYGDDIGVRSAWATVDAARPQEVVAFLRRNVGSGRGPVRRPILLAAALAAGPARAREAFAAHCELAAGLAGKLSLGPGVQSALRAIFERWDGKGFPNGLHHDELPPAARLVHIARDFEVFRALAGREKARYTVDYRSGSAYDPELAAHCVRHAGDLVSGITEDDVWSVVLEREPPGAPLLRGDDLESACEALGDFADLKSPYTLGHCTGVADLAEAAAWRAGLDAEDVGVIRRAALVHDVGRVAVSNAIWDRPGPLHAGEWEEVRLHPLHTERVLGRCGGLAAEAAIAGAHHERLDGSGYHRRLPAAMLAKPVRILQAADAFHAMTEPRPHRTPRAPQQAAELLTDEARGGRLDGDAVDAVLAAAGERATRPHEWPAGLTDREVDVLRLISRGLTNKAVAQQLNISAKTVGHHVGHVYTKAGVRTRAGAALFAVEHDLLRDDAKPG